MFIAYGFIYISLGSIIFMSSESSNIYFLPAVCEDLGVNNYSIVTPRNVNCLGQLIPGKIS
jgi:hypothetical protein